MNSFRKGTALELAEKRSMGVKTCQGTAFSRAVKPFKMNNSTLPKACAQRSGAP